MMNTFVMTLTLFIGGNAWADKPANNADAITKAKAVYAVKCLTCHGDKGDGMGPAGKYMSPKPRNFAKDKFKLAKDGAKPTDAEVFNSITKGLDGTSMVAFADLPEADRWALAYYVQSFRK